VNPPVWTIVAMAIGLALMLLGPLLVGTLPAQAVWSDESAREYQKAASDLHEATYGAGHSHEAGRAHVHKTPAPDDPTVLAARAAFAEQETRLNAARARPFWLEVAVRALGAIVAAVGVGGYFRAKAAAAAEAKEAKAARKHHRH
jgi:hypothetical protein